ncbi:MAG: HU family DNA-binding protein [Treponema sp.]|nr:HU family DNA-binding protein [Treponema sp.]
MTKHELVGEMAAELGITKKQCTQTLNAMIEEIVSTLETGGKFTQPGFGTFKATQTKERVGRNPATGEKVLYPQKCKVKFRASDILKGEINE